jgi:hypothetical protein
MAVQCLAALQARAGMRHPDPARLRQFRATPEGTTATLRDVPLTERPPAGPLLTGAGATVRTRTPA